MTNRSLDSLIATHIYNMKILYAHPNPYFEMWHYAEEEKAFLLAPYSSEIKHAFGVIDKIDELVSITQVEGDLWECVVYMTEGYKIKALDNDPCRAICMAVLESRGVSI
jgi:hypothetical protein